MWSYLTLALILGAAVAVNHHEHGWASNTEYVYHVRSRTLTGLDKLSQQFSGIVLKGSMVIQAETPTSLTGKIINLQYAQVHSTLPDGWDVYIPDEQLHYQDLQVSGKPFKVNLKHGVIREVVIEKDVPAWETNLLKSFLSPLQLDTEGENAKLDNNIQIPTHKEPYAMFNVIEATVGGECEVHYDIMPLSKEALNNNPELVPVHDYYLPEQLNIDIIKTKNYSKCVHENDYHFGVNGDVYYRPKTNYNTGFIARTSTTRTVITGSLKKFLIQSSTTINEINVSPQVNDVFVGTVYNRVNVTLKQQKPIEQPFASLDNPVSIGNLMYMAYTDVNQIRPHLPTISRNSMQVVSSENSDSASEEKQRTLMSLLSNDRFGEMNPWQNEQEVHYQNKQKINKALENSFLPYFIGYHGKNIQKSGKIDVVRVSKRFIETIARELKTPEDMVDVATLEKYTILIEIVRLMDVEQINELENIISLDSNHNHYEVLRDVITQAGTGPSFLTIKKWILEARVQGIEAAQIISKIPKVVRVPTTEYIQEFFELIKEPVVQKQLFLNSSAPYAFSELLFHVYKKQNRYPVNRPMVPKNDDTLLKVYIPYFVRQMEEGIRNGNSLQAQTYIAALGKTGHSHILAIFEPYLEGTKHASTHQRLLMVSSLYSLTETHPVLASSVLFKIYANVQEAHELRCAAVYLLMNTDPSLTMLQRIARYTHIDKNAHVNSAVKSILESLANLKEPQFFSLSSKARIAKEQLTKNEYNYNYSHGYVTEVHKALNKLYVLITETIGSTDSDVPKAFSYISPNADINGLPSTKMSYAVSSVKQFQRKFNIDRTPETSTGQSRVEQLVRALNIQTEQQKPLEGIFLFSNMYKSDIFPFDDYVIDTLIKEFKTNVPSYKKKVHNFLFNYDASVSFPMETGLLFSFSIVKPMLLKHDLKHVGSNNNNVLDLALVSKQMCRFGFLTQHDHQYYVAGIDNDVQVILPITYDYKLNQEEKSVQLRIRPNLKNDAVMPKMLVNKVLPFTSISDLLSLVPVSLDRNTQLVHTKPADEVQTTSFDVELFNVTISNEGKPWKNIFDITKQLNILKDEVSYKLIEVQPHVKLSQDWITIGLTYGEREPEANELQNQPRKPISPDLSDIFRHLTDRKQRVDHMLSEVRKNVVSPIVRAVDVTLDIPYWARQYIATIGLASSKVQQTPNYQNFVYLQSLHDRVHNYEVCVNSHLSTTQCTPLNFERSIDNTPKNDFVFEMQYGKTCATGQKVDIVSTHTRNDIMKQTIVKSDVVRKCRQEMQQGNKALRACQKANILAELKNHVQMSMQIPEESVNTITNILLSQSGIEFNPVKIVEHEYSQEYPDDKRQIINMEINVSPDYKNAEVAFRNSQFNTKFPIDISKVQLLNGGLKELWKQEGQVSCAIDKNQAVTFDGKVYPVKLGQCQHVMLTSLPQEYFDYSTESVIPREMQIAVLVQETQDNTKQVLIFAGNTEIELRQVYNHKELIINKQKVKLGSHVVKEADEVIGQIIELPDKSVHVQLVKYGLDILYDGERVQTRVSDNYRNAIRGLCGNFDGQVDNDFITPKNCILAEPELFAAMYALTKHHCQGPAVKNRQRAEQAECVPQKYHQSNVISDKEAGRVWTENKDHHWGYHWNNEGQELVKRCTQYRTKILEDSDEICFSLRPLPECIVNCQSSHVKTKRVPLHCLPRNDASIQMKLRIEQGANPDLSQRSVSKTQTFELPLACVAA